MLSAKLIMLKRINSLYGLRFIFFIPFLILIHHSEAQDNSPYSRYGIGDIVPSTNIISRGMGGLSAGYADIISVNFNNPASYSLFQAFQEANSKKLASGRVVLDIGTNFESRTLREPNNTEKFTANNALFSYLQVGVPLKKNWGISLGLRPVSRISYKISRIELLIDPQTQLPIDTAQTLFSGDGGVFLPTIGTGYKIKNFSFGVNIGYMFGKKNYSTKRGIINDTVQYLLSNHETRATFGNLFYNAGLQYDIKLADQFELTLGAYGNFKRELEASQDVIRETYYQDAITGDTRLDSVFEQTNIKGSVIYPSSFGFGFTAKKNLLDPKKTGWIVGVDFVQTKWDNYRFYGMKDSVRNNWELRVGTQIRPILQKGFFSRIFYRAGFFTGTDYIKVKNKLPQYGFSFGAGLPLRSSDRFSVNQLTYLNLAFEYIKRGNNDNLLRENLFRLSASFSLSDLWFFKRKYE